MASSKYCDVCGDCVSFSCPTSYHQSQLPNGQIFTGLVCSDCGNKPCGSHPSCGCKMAVRIRAFRDEGFEIRIAIDKARDREIPGAATAKMKLEEELAKKKKQEEDALNMQRHCQNESILAQQKANKLKEELAKLSNDDI